MISPEVHDLHLTLLRDLHATWRAMKGRPGHDGKLRFIADHARFIGKTYAEAGGLQALASLITQLEETGGAEVAEWASRRFEGIVLADGSIWFS